MICEWRLEFKQTSLKYFPAIVSTYCTHVSSILFGTTTVLFCSLCERTWERLNKISLLQITFKNEVGQYDLEVTTFQLAVLFAWNQRPRERISFENLKLATELPDAELRRTLWVIGDGLQTGVGTFTCLNRRFSRCSDASVEFQNWSSFFY